MTSSEDLELKTPTQEKIKTKVLFGKLEDQSIHGMGRGRWKHSILIDCKN